MFRNKETISGYPCSTPKSPRTEKNAKRRVASVQSYQSGSSSTIVCATMQLHVSNLENQKKAAERQGDQFLWNIYQQYQGYQ